MFKFVNAWKRLKTKMQYHPIYFCSSLPANALAFSTLNLRFIFYHFDPFYYFVNAFIATFCLYILWVYIVLFVVLFCFVSFLFLSNLWFYNNRLCTYDSSSFTRAFFVFLYCFLFFFLLLLLYCTNLGVMGVMPDNGIIVGDYLVASTSPTSD